MYKSLIALCLGCASAAAAAGDLAEFRALGFSADGRYYAFAQLGSHDGSGYPFADVAVVDVAKNDLIAVKNARIEDESASPTAALRQALTAIRLKRFGIGHQAAPGTNLLWRAPTDNSADQPYRFIFTSAGHVPMVDQQPEYEIVVEETATRALADEPLCAELGGPRLLKVSLVGRERSDGSVKVLQTDERLPKSRACPLGYSVRGVTEYRDGLVVVLAYTRPGFEGPDTRYMVVTGNVVPPP